MQTYIIRELDKRLLAWDRFQDTATNQVFEGHANAVPPGRSCVGVAYTNREVEIESSEINSFSALMARIVDGMGIANALLIRIQGLLLPVPALVFSG